jgi:hypothetical protein
MKAVRELKRELIHIGKKANLVPGDIVNIMSKIRTILEEDGKLKSQSPLVNLFANWCLHGKITHSKVVYNCLYSISKNISRYLNGVENYPSIVHEAMNTLNIPEFRKQLIPIFHKHKLPDFIIHSQNWWEGFIQIMLHELSEKMVSFPDNVISGNDTNHFSYPIFKKILDLANKNGKNSGFVKLHIELIDDRFYICIDTLNEATFVFECRGKELRSRFRDP